MCNSVKVFGVVRKFDLGFDFSPPTCPTTKPLRLGVPSEVGQNRPTRSADALRWHKKRGGIVPPLLVDASDVEGYTVNDTDSVRRAFP